MLNVSIAMANSWQDLVVLGLIVTAAIYLFRRFRRIGRGKTRTGCGGCSACSHPDTSEQLISIDPPKRS